MNNNFNYWVSYDFANSFLSVTLEGLFFSQWIIIDNKLPEIWYGGVFAASTFLLLVTVPFIGAWSDVYGRKMPFLQIVSGAMAIFGIILGIVTCSFLPTPLKMILALIVFFIIQYLYQVSLTFYNALLKQISTSKNKGVVSGVGQLANNAGYLIASGLFLFLINKHFALFGTSGRSQVFIPATILFGFLSLPMLLCFKEHQSHQSKKTIIQFAQIYKDTIHGLRQLFGQQKNVGIFLVAFMLVSDATLTANLFSPVVLNEVFHIPDSQKFVLIILMSLFVMPSSYLCGKIGDKFGFKKILQLCCICIAISFLLIGVATSLSQLYLLFMLLGIGWGGFITTSRAMFVVITPQKQLGEYFGYYATFQRFASIIGPLTWSGIAFALINLGAVRYRIAQLSLVILIVGGMLLLSQVEEKTKRTI